MVIKNLQKNEKEQCKDYDSILVHEVLDYYKKNGRHSLLWRKKITAYRVLVSEVMLQQTQVTRVSSKYEEWMKIYPTLKALGKSSLKEVLTLWQGLGYQRRAKALLIIAQQKNRLPKTFSELLALSGVGTYTASAVMAFAYNTFAHPVLETNIRTVLIEHFHQGEEKVHDGALYDDLVRLEKNKKVQLVGARTWYYALMDYGAYLKSAKISHNNKSVHYTKQSPYKGSFRELRAKVLFAIIHKTALPADDRVSEVLEQLMREGYIHALKKHGEYVVR